MPLLASLTQPLLRRLPPETAHNLSLHALRLGLAGQDTTTPDPTLQVTAFSRTLPNPIGLAAGFDKNATAINPLAALGFGFIETGTVTPLPQPGNPRPRLFRLPADRAVINRMGFNNAGLQTYLQNLQSAAPTIPIGANIGINKTGANPERDYPMLATAVAPFADYITINISSPNTPGLRDLQSEARLKSILSAITTTKPLFVKIAPDLSEDSLAAIINTCIDAKITGLIIANTTTARPATLASPHAHQTGGLSGAPLLEPSTKMLGLAYKLSEQKLTLIGAGGIFTPADAFAKILAGATLIQLYTAFAYHGPALIPHLKRGLSALVRQRGLTNIAQAIGAGQ